MMKLDQKGFTIPELTTMMVVGLMFSILIIFFGFNFWRTAALQEADQDTLITRLNAGDFIRDNIGESSGLIVQNGLTDDHVLNADPNQPNGLYWLPIHAISDTNIPMGNEGTYTPLLYFKKFSFNSSKNIIMNSSVPYEDEFVMYLDGSTKKIMSRSIANPNALDNRLLSSCPPAIANSNCPADKVVAEDVASVDVRYFSRNGTILDFTSSTDESPPYDFNGPDFPLVEVVELKINLRKKAIFESSDSTFNNTIIRISLRNS